MSKLKITVGIIVTALAIFLNFRYAYGGYGISSFLPKSLAFDDTQTTEISWTTRTTGTTGTTGSPGGPSDNARLEIQPAMSLCTIYHHTVYAEVWEVICDADGTFHETKLVGNILCYDLTGTTQAVWDQSPEIDRNALGLTPIEFIQRYDHRRYSDVENVHLTRSVCIPDAQEGPCAPVAPNCSSYSGNNSGALS